MKILDGLLAILEMQLTNWLSNVILRILVFEYSDGSYCHSKCNNFRDKCLFGFLA